MDLALTLAAVALAAAYLMWRAWRTFSPKARAARGCGCGSDKAGCPAASQVAEQIRRGVGSGRRAG